MRVLIACEFSGIVRDEFLKLGHDAMSCDLLPTESPGPHYQGSVLDILDDGFDLMIAHPPCTFHTVSCNRWFYETPKNPKPGILYGEARREAREKDRIFVKTLYNANIPKICIENPIGTLGDVIGKPTQIIQPWQFGHGETKATCLWLKNLPKLVPTNIVSGRKGKVHQMTPSEDRWKLRSITYKGIAEAMAQQWGK